MAKIIRLNKEQSDMIIMSLENQKRFLEDPSYNKDVPVYLLMYQINIIDKLIKKIKVAKEVK